MKKLLSLVLVLCLIPSFSLAEYTALRDVQMYVLRYTEKAGEPRVCLSGDILEIYHVTTNHWEMKVAVNEENAPCPLGAERPYFIAHFRLHADSVPFSVGDPVVILGTLNYMYSSPMIPFVNVDTVNGNDDF